MDGAIILAADASRIARANVHLVPKASIPTSETGTRHRTAERVARSIDVPVIVGLRGHGHHRRVPQRRQAHPAADRPGGRPGRQALSTLQRFKTRFDLALATLSTLEVEDTVSVRDVVAVLQPGEMVVRIAEEIEGYLVELGDDGRLIRLQLEELEAGVPESLRLVVRDYVVDHAPRPDAVGRRQAGPTGRQGGRRGGRVLVGGPRALEALHGLSADALSTPAKVAATLGLGSDELSLDAGVEARGYRLLSRLPRVSDAIIERIVDRSSPCPQIMQASLGDLEKVGGVGGAKARSVKDGLARMVEASIFERYE